MQGSVKSMRSGWMVEAVEADGRGRGVRYERIERFSHQDVSECKKNIVLNAVDRLNVRGECDPKIMWYFRNTKT